LSRDIQTPLKAALGHVTTEELHM